MDLTNKFIFDLKELHDKKFGCIYIDPPWRYSNKSTRGAANDHYKTMNITEIASLPIKELSAENAHLHLWTTNAFLFECIKLFDIWGFNFKSSFIWVKPTIGLGNYWRNSHEFLLLGVKGKATAKDKSLRSWIEQKRTTHSTKPEVIRNLIERLSPDPYLELFGRKPAKNWVVWGNELIE